MFYNQYHERAVKKLQAIEDKTMTDENKDFDLNAELKALAFVTENECAYVRYTLKSESGMFGEQEPVTNDEGEYIVQVTVEGIGAEDVNLTSKDLSDIRDGKVIAEASAQYATANKMADRRGHRLEITKRMYTGSLFNDNF